VPSARRLLSGRRISRKRHRVPTARGGEVECEVVVVRALPALGMTWARGRDRAVIALRDDVAEGLQRGEREAQITALHELAHVVWDHGAPAGTPEEEAAREARAEAFAQAAVWLLRRG